MKQEKDSKVSQFLHGLYLDKSHSLKNIVSPLYYGVPDTPQAGVPHSVVPVSLLTHLSQITDTVRPVVLQLAQAGVH